MADLLLFPEPQTIPDAPQLPLYALFQPDTLGGIAFAQLRPGSGLSLSGFADDSTVLATSAKAQTLPIAEQVEAWRLVLTQLAVAFAQGDTRVLPKSYPGTCQHCGQRILCRLDVNALNESADDDLAQENTHG